MISSSSLKIKCTIGFVGDLYSPNEVVSKIEMESVKGKHVDGKIFVLRCEYPRCCKNMGMARSTPLHGIDALDGVSRIVQGVRDRRPVSSIARST